MKAGEFAWKLCGGTDLRAKLHVANANFSSRIESFDVLECVACGLSTMSPYPTSEDVKEVDVRAVFSRPRSADPNVGKFLSDILKRLYKKYGTYYPVLIVEFACAEFRS
jgi:hypothetical protein